MIQCNASKKQTRNNLKLQIASASAGVVDEVGWKYPIKCDDEMLLLIFCTKASWSVRGCEVWGEGTHSVDTCPPLTW